MKQSNNGRKKEIYDSIKGNQSAVSDGNLSREEEEAEGSERVGGAIGGTEGSGIDTFEIEDGVENEGETEEDQDEDTQSPKHKLKPMSPLAASATVVNLLLATGPFTYPEGFVELGPVTSSILLITTCFIAYVTALFMVEAISVAYAVENVRREARKTRREERRKQRSLNDTIFSEDTYESPEVCQKLTV